MKNTVEESRVNGIRGQKIWFDLKILSGERVSRGRLESAAATV